MAMESERPKPGRVRDEEEQLRTRPMTSDQEFDPSYTSDDILRLSSSKKICEEERGESALLFVARG